ncbi:hypothetical protein [Litoreibacter janthinus]|uniref:YMGG-like Gly-zipper n=1 Tax=Litoreibacter janthinus TaxID=670154 RepID=A0A1I6HLR0_9RHOB|nr:hypothetical protein [Litoreibacter janthinus]SFR55401.1 hypothetical protein SAMN04488002_3147 [Litoreibacter janthinus]
MRKTLITSTFIAAAFALSACDSDAERGLVGAGAGAAIASATGGSAVTGAVIGGAAGVFCDDAGICK